MNREWTGKVFVRSDNRGSRRGPGHPGRALAAALVPLLLLPLFLSAGCGSNSVAAYLDTARPVLDTVAARYEILRGYSTVRLADRAGMGQAVLDFRKAISQGQGRLDTTHEPPPCEDLDNTLRKYLDTGRDIADIITGYADYLSQLAPVAGTTGEVVELLAQLEQKEDVASGLVTLQNKSTLVTNSFQAVQSTPSFDNVHRQFLGFLQTLNALLNQQSSDTGRQQYTPDNNNYDEQSSSTHSDTQKSKSKVTIALSEVPQVWADLNASISSAVETMLMSSPFKIKSEEFLAEAQQAVKQIQDLQTQYHIAPPQPAKK